MWDLRLINLSLRNQEGSFKGNIFKYNIRFLVTPDYVGYSVKQIKELRIFMSGN